MDYRKILVSCARLLTFTTLSMYIFYKDIYPYGSHMKKLFGVHANVTATINEIEARTKKYEIAFQQSTQIATSLYVVFFQMRRTSPSKNKEDVDVEGMSEVYESTLYYRGRDLSLQQKVFNKAHFSSEVLSPFFNHLVEVNQRRLQRLKSLTNAMNLYHASLISKEGTKSFLKYFKDEVMSDEGTYFDLQSRCLDALSLLLDFQVSILQGCIFNAQILTGFLIIYQLGAIVILAMKIGKNLSNNIVTCVYILSIVFLYFIKESLILGIQYRLNDPDKWSEVQINQGDQFLALQFPEIHAPYHTWLIIASMSLSHLQFDLILKKIQTFIRKHWPKKKLPIDGQEEIKSANENPVLEELEMHQRIKRIKNEVRKIFECCVCLEYMKRPGPRYIYGCTNDHYICSKCLKSPTIKSCPQCRECFRKHSPKRRYQSEAMQELFQKLFEIHKS